ncbi:pyridoxamine 5'-phosphate oxidase family protein [Xanthobacter sp. DSM 24535]|uniref:pyridoxamine 5'-phosphate oxidase family protein n=1 Tax=Roseixanthobacter psychrophilus TaxID=3119917 RepID=UPI00372BE03B
MSKVESREALRQLYKPAHGRSVAKEIHLLDRHCRDFIALSPFVLLASGGSDGFMDVSPCGDHPGFVVVEDDTTLLLPDRPGNNRLDSLENILERPGVGLLFLIPGVDETLRVNGRAEIHASAELNARFAVAGKVPASVLRVHVQSAYLHCAKSLMRSALWSAEAKVARSALPTMGEMLKDHARLEAPAETQEEMLQRYKSVLY